MAIVLENGSTFAGHRVDRLLGAGGMGEVYLATEVGSGETVALKVISQAVAADERFRRRFERESRLARRLEHPHLVTVRDTGESEGRLFLTMAYVEGSDLEALLIVRERIHPRDAATVISQVAGALDAAAEQGLVHRDVKPANVFLRGDTNAPDAQLGDFGLTKHVSSTSGLTQTGSWVGTIDYAAPEQIRAGDVDRRTDVYALGAVLCQALCGRVPFERARDIDRMMAHLSDPPPRPSTLVGSVPTEFDEVVRRAMAKAPEDRYPTAGALGLDALAAADRAGPAPPWFMPSPSVVGRPADPDAPTAG